MELPDIPEADGNASLPGSTPAMYSWQVWEADRGEWNSVGVSIAGETPLPMVTSRWHVAESMRPYAELHAESTGKPVRLVMYHNVEVLEVIP